MIGKLIIEILILWIIYALYMAILVHKRGPLGGIFFYPRVMQERVIEIGLMTEQELRSRRTFAYILLLALMILVPGFMILRINGARTYFSCWLLESQNEADIPEGDAEKMLQLIPVAIPVSALIGAFYWGIKVLTIHG